MADHRTRTDADIESKVLWLRNTLIPDLRDSGQDNLADDLEEDCQIIEQLKEERDNAKRAAHGLIDPN